MPRKTKETDEIKNNVITKSLPKNIKSSSKNTTKSKTTSTSTSTNKKTSKNTKKTSTTSSSKIKTTNLRNVKSKKSTSSVAKSSSKKNQSVKELNSKSKKANIIEYYDLPYRYNQTVVKILAQTPNILFVYWDISDTDRNNFISQYGENFFNNTIPVLLIINKTMNYSYEIQINDFANSWYLHVNDANCEYQVELGRRHKENPNYYYVTTSNNLDMPNNHILLENISNNVLFKNVKTQELVEKPITSITFFKDFAKSKDFYKYFKELLNNELEGDEINFNLPSSHTSSSFK